MKTFIVTRLALSRARLDARRAAAVDRVPAQPGMNERPIAAFSADFDRVRKAVSRRRALPI